MYHTVVLSHCYSTRLILKKKWGWDGRILLVWPSRIPNRISKILFALGADEFLAMLEGKIRVTPFF